MTPAFSWEAPVWVGQGTPIQTVKATTDVGIFVCWNEFKIAPLKFNIELEKDNFQ